MFDEYQGKQQEESGGKGLLLIRIVLNGFYFGLKEYFHKITCDVLLKVLQR